MNDKYIKDAFEGIDTSNDVMIQKVNDVLSGKGKIKKVSRYRAAAVACVVMILIGVVAAVDPGGMTTYAQEAINKWVKTIQGDNGKVKETGNYITLKNTKASRTDAKYTTLSEIEEVLGVNLIQSEKAYEKSKNMISYTPYVDDGQINGAMITDDQYSLGDIKLKRVIGNTRDVSSCPSMKFDLGKKYKSTLMVQITIRADKAPSDPYSNKELSYLGEEWELPEGTALEKYALPNIDTTAVIYEIGMDGGLLDSDGSGPAGSDNYNEMMPATVAMMEYEGIEYMYTARVSFDTMKDFLDTLK